MSHRRRKGLKVGGAEMLVVAAKVDSRRRGMGAQPPDADKSMIACNFKVAKNSHHQGNPFYSKYVQIVYIVCIFLLL